MWGDRYTIKNNLSNWRILSLQGFFVLFGVVIVARLWYLQIVQASFYQAIASGQHEFYEELIADRGKVFVRDWKDQTEYIAASNEFQAFIYADPRKITDPETVTREIAKLLEYDLNQASINLSTNETPSLESSTSTEYEILLSRLSKSDDPYEPIAHNVNADILNDILLLNYSGIYYIYEDARAYPEKNIGGHIFGFVQQDYENGLFGQYGVEGYYDDFLSGKNGYLDAVTDSTGSWIGVGHRDTKPAQDGGDILLTIDRSIQYNACKTLADGVKTYEADSGSLIILEPKTGKIIAMCTTPDFDPNNYGEVDDVSIYNNLAIFEAYEPGSVVKPLVMATALDVNAVEPSTTYEDTGEVLIEGYLKPIKNSDLKAHGIQTMTEVLEKSLNTGMVFVMQQIGGKVMVEYLKQFGFGTLTGIDLDTEVSGIISALENDHDAFYAPASYGQGFTLTLMQLTSAYGALANEGWLMQPYIVEEKRYTDGTIEKIMPTTVRQVIDSSTATTIGAMLVSVVENGHSKNAAVSGYYIGGKTGTAQVANEGGYGDLTNATFAGYGPIEDPRFVIAVRLEHPRTNIWAENTAAVIYQDVAEYILEYFEVAPSRY